MNKDLERLLEIQHIRAKTRRQVDWDKLKEISVEPLLKILMELDIEEKELKSKLNEKLEKTEKGSLYCPKCNFEYLDPEDDKNWSDWQLEDAKKQIEKSREKYDKIKNYIKGELDFHSMQPASNNTAPIQDAIISEYKNILKQIIENDSN